VAWIVLLQKTICEGARFSGGIEDDSKNPVLLCHAGLIYAVRDEMKQRPFAGRHWPMTPICRALKTASLDTLRSLQEDQTTDHVHSTKMI